MRQGLVPLALRQGVPVPLSEHDKGEQERKSLGVLRVHRKNRKRLILPSLQSEEQTLRYAHAHA